MGKVSVLLTLVYALCNVAHYAAGNARLVSEVPNPIIHPSACRLTNGISALLCDPDSILKQKERDSISSSMEKVTIAKLVVVIIERMNTNFSNEPAAEKYVDYLLDRAKKRYQPSLLDLQAGQFAHSLLENWKIGSIPEKDDGIILFMSIKDKAVFIACGTNVSDYYLNGMSMENLILNKLDYSMKKSKWCEALIISIKEINRLLLYKEDFTLLITVFSLVISCSVCIWACERRPTRSYKPVPVDVKLLMFDVVNTPEGNKYYAASCPICLEDYALNDVLTDKVNTEKEEINSDLESLIVPNQDNPSVNCFEGNKTSKALRCGHTFCAECLELHLRSFTGVDCPFCRQPVRSYHRLSC